MDPVTLMHQVMNELAPIMPYIGSTGTAIAGKIGEDIYERGKKLYQLIHTRFAQEPDDKASNALQAFVDDSDVRSTVETKLLRLIQNDSRFADALFNVIQTSPQMFIEAYDDAIIRKNTIENSLGGGSQRITGSGKSLIEENQMKISYE